MESLLLLEKDSFRKILIYPIDSSGKIGSYSVSFTTVGQRGKDSSACKVDLLPAAEVDLSQYENLLKRSIYGCLGIIRIASGNPYPDLLIV